MECGAEQRVLPAGPYPAGRDPGTAAQDGDAIPVDGAAYADQQAPGIAVQQPYGQVRFTGAVEHIGAAPPGLVGTAVEVHPDVVRPHRHRGAHADTWPSNRDAGRGTVSVAGGNAGCPSPSSRYITRRMLEPNRPGSEEILAEIAAYSSLGYSAAA